MATQTVTVNGESVEVREVAMTDLEVGMVIVQPATKATVRRRNSRVLNPAYAGHLATILKIHVMKSQIAAYTDHGTYRHRADLSVLVRA